MAYAKKTTQEESSGCLASPQDLKLCYNLGFFFWVHGILIAAVVAKSEGVRRALKGFRQSFFLVLFLVLCIFWIRIVLK